jgi:hypothetical protein
MDIPLRIERSYLEPPYEPPLYVECAYCTGEIRDEDAIWEGDTPYCSEDCLLSDKYDRGELDDE